ncbi:MAG: Yip1 family protein [Paracoccus sp. (in: a-proteobacteria)]
MTFSDLSVIIRNSFTAPDLAMRQLIALDLPLSARWMALGLAIAASTVISMLTVAMYPVAAPPVMMLFSPFSFAAIQLTLTATGAVLLSSLGRIFGGRGNFADSLLLVAWIELLLLGAQLVQVLLLIVPMISGLFGLAAVIALTWVMVRMIQALHKFSNVFLVFLGLIFGTIMTLLIAVSIASALGLMSEITPEMLNEL